MKNNVQLFNNMILNILLILFMLKSTQSLIKNLIQVGQARFSGEG